MAFLCALGKVPGVLNHTQCSRLVQWVPVRLLTCSAEHSTGQTHRGWGAEGGATGHDPKLQVPRTLSPNWLFLSLPVSGQMLLHPESPPLPPPETTSRPPAADSPTAGTSPSQPSAPLKSHLSSCLAPDCEPGSSTAAGVSWSALAEGPEQGMAPHLLRAMVWSIGAGGFLESDTSVARMASSHFYCLVTTAHIQGQAVLGDLKRGYRQSLALTFPPSLGELAGQQSWLTTVQVE